MILTYTVVIKASVVYLIAWCVLPSFLSVRLLYCVINYQAATVYLVACVLTFRGSSVVLLIRLHSEAKFYTAAKMNNTSPTLQLYQVALPPESAVVNIFVNIFVLVSNLLAVMAFRKLEKLYIQHYFMG